MANETGFSMDTDRQIGQMLLEGGFISREQLEDALETARRESKNLRLVLLEKQYISPETYSTFLSIKTRVPIVDLKQVTIEADALKLLPEELAKQYKAIPLALEGDSLRVAMENPHDVGAINALQAATGRRIKPRLPVNGTVDEAIRQYYGAAPQMSNDLRNLLGESLSSGLSALNLGAQGVQESGAASAAHSPELANTPIVKALDMIIAQAVKDRASDIHIEPTDKAVRVRFRIDGILHDVTQLPKGVHTAIVSRLKILGGMDIAERRRPQDGHFTLTVNGSEIDFRVASMDSAYGELVVIRVLNRSATLMSLTDLGFHPEVLRDYQKLLNSPYGMVLVSGPTGSGKTTTLYASIAQLDAVSHNIMSIEDPIEYRFQNINQTQVNPQAGITFASGLRGIMRLDPDIILVGEIRDQETARVAVQAALTGHLVLSSIHANDSAAAVIRLTDLGVERFLVSSAVIGSVAQRLVRRICKYCKTLAPGAPHEVAAYEQELGEHKTEFYVGRGCNMCSQTGYSGRVAVNEVMVLSPAIQALISKDAPSDEIRKAAIRAGMMTMRRAGMLKVKDGVTTVSEVLRNVFTIDLEL